MFVCDAGVGVGVVVDVGVDVGDVDVGVGVDVDVDVDSDVVVIRGQGHQRASCKGSLVSGLASPSLGPLPLLTFAIANPLQIHCKFNANPLRPRTAQCNARPDCKGSLVRRAEWDRAPPLLHHLTAGLGVNCRWISTQCNTSQRNAIHRF